MWSGHFRLIHKSVGNYMDRQAYLWSDLDLRVVSFYKSNYIAEMEWMLNDYKSTQNLAAPKVAITVISIQFTYIYDTPMKLS